MSDIKRIVFRLKGVAVKHYVMFNVNTAKGMEYYTDWGVVLESNVLSKGGYSDSGGVEL